LTVFLYVQLITNCFFLILDKETFAELEFLGFYVSGDHERVIEDDIYLQRQALQHNESPFLLKFNVFAPVISDKVGLII